MKVEKRWLSVTMLLGFWEMRHEKRALRGTTADMV
jgi:hypothetical protein